MEYVEIRCRLEPPEPWRDIFIAEFAELGFESFAEEPDGFRAYIPAADFEEDALIECINELQSGGHVQCTYGVQQLGGQNWNAVWESNFEPVLIAGRCLIRAPFHSAMDDIEYEIIIEPKMSFGTGHHETTTLVVEWMLESEFENKTVLDMGCGTGVLAILAAKMGAKRVTAIDNYLYAWENTMENVARNGIENMLILHGDADLLVDDHYDVIIANITRNVLLDDMPAYNKVLNRGGVLLLSGFLSFDKDHIFDGATKLGLMPGGEKRSNDWVSLKFLKP
ncbi:MAG: 50S ribosomal protein L11 methyltransferase [Bacteroidia bacterium]|nr:MAG: 50S ribosomal protein L11 methyltransferase [Bacteroidia bacterium]